MVGYVGGAVIWRVADGDAALPRRVQVDVVEPDACANHDPAAQYPVK